MLCRIDLYCIRRLIDRKDKVSAFHGNGGKTNTGKAATFGGDLNVQQHLLSEFHMSDEEQCVFCEVETQLQVLSQTREKRL
jgi:hypothetical protein